MSVFSSPVSCGLRGAIGSRITAGPETTGTFSRIRSLVPVGSGGWSIVAEERIVAVALLTQRELDVLGPSFSRIWPVDETPCFAELLRKIDEADRQLQSPAASGETPD